MAALGDRSERSVRPELTPEIAQRTLFFLEHHPSQPLSTWINRFKREHIPQRLRRMYAAEAEHASSATDPPPPRCLRFRAPSARAAGRRGGPRWPPRSATDRDLHDPTLVAHLRRLLSGFVLTPEAARRLLIEPRARHAFTRYFNTGQPLIDVCNALQIHLALLERTDFEASATGKTSRRIAQTLLGLRSQPSAKRRSAPAPSLCRDGGGPGSHPHDAASRANPAGAVVEARSRRSGDRARRGRYCPAPASGLPQLRRTSWAIVSVGSSLVCRPVPYNSSTKARSRSAVAAGAPSKSRTRRTSRAASTVLGR